MDFDTLYRYSAANVTIDGKVYKLDESYAEEGSNVVSTVYDGRTNTQIRLSDGQSTTIKFENGATLTVKAEGQTYNATLTAKRRPSCRPARTVTRTLQGQQTEPKR